MEHKETIERNTPKSPTIPSKVENVHPPHIVKPLSDNFFNNLFDLILF